VYQRHDSHRRPKVYSDFSSLLKYRNWLAHGRYFPDKSGLGDRASPELASRICFRLLSTTGIQTGPTQAT
jgi:hypothetical protein